MRFVIMSFLLFTSSFLYANNQLNLLIKIASNPKIKEALLDKEDINISIKKHTSVFSSRFNAIGLEQYSFIIKYNEKGSSYNCTIIARASRVEGSDFSSPTILTPICESEVPNITLPEIIDPSELKGF